MRRTIHNPRRKARRRDRGNDASLLFATLAAFYGDDPRRASSREVDVGLWWREAADDPLHRAAWVAATGELYAVRLGPPRDTAPAVELLAVIDDEDSIESVLSGWREHCGEPGSLAWLRARTAAARPSRPAETGRAAARRGRARERAEQQRDTVLRSVGVQLHGAMR